MAIYQPGALIGGISGTVGGANFVAGRGSDVVRKNRRALPPRGPGIRQAQSEINFYVRAWAELTENQRLAWRNAAKVFPHHNRLGQSNFLTGQQLFIRVNLEWHIVPTVIFETPSTLGVSETPRDFDVTLSASGSLTWSANPPYGVNAARFVVFARPLFTPTKPKNVGKMNFLYADSLSSLTRNMRTEIEAIWGAPVEGQWMLCGCAAAAPGYYRSKILTLIEQVGS